MNLFLLFQLIKENIPRESRNISNYVHESLIKMTLISVYLSGMYIV